jgi:hypothetical protein
MILHLELGPITLDLHVGLREREPRMVGEDNTVKIMDSRRF